MSFSLPLRVGHRPVCYSSWTPHIQVDRCWQPSEGWQGPRRSGVTFLSWWHEKMLVTLHCCTAAGHWHSTRVCHKISQQTETESVTQIMLLSLFSFSITSDPVCRKTFYLMIFEVLLFHPRHTQLIQSADLNRMGNTGITLQTGHQSSMTWKPTQRWECRREKSG